jgi:hypothetical protein
MNLNRDLAGGVTGVIAEGSAAGREAACKRGVRFGRRLCGVSDPLGRAGAAQRSAAQDDASAPALGQGLIRPRRGHSGDLAVIACSTVRNSGQDAGLTSDPRLHPLKIGLFEGFGKPPKGLPVGNL